jgi:hypothetical protein
MQTSPDGPALSTDADPQAEGRKRHITETIAAFNKAVDPAKLTSLSNKSLEEVTTLQQEIADIIPVGNVAALVLSSLTQLKDRVIQPDRARRDIEALMRGLDVVKKAFYNTAFFASPAAILFAYQKILTLAGKDVHSAFPEGLWQFYLEFSMREDTARHTNETCGFQKSLATHNLNLPLLDQLTAWTNTIINLYFQYDALLLTEWSERVYLKLLEAEARRLDRDHDPFFQNLKKKWNRQKPFGRTQDVAAHETYAQFRKRRFQRYCEPRLQSLPKESQEHLSQRYQELLHTEAPAFQEQLSILATLDPGQYREVRRPVPIWQARLAIIWQGEYHLLPACAINEEGQLLCYDLERANLPPIPLALDRNGRLSHARYGLLQPQPDGMLLTEEDQIPIGRLQPLPLHQLRHWIWAIISGQYLSNLDASAFDSELMATPRSRQDRERKKLNANHATSLELLKMAPVIIDWDQTALEQPLSTARLGRRGVGDQALTIFRTSQTIIFDQSHIFFDGLWGLSLVEILTNEAISWAAYLAGLPPLEPGKPIAAPDTNRAFRVTPESSAECSAIDMAATVQMRKHLVQRHREIVFTINDLLILYRSLFNQEYCPGEALSKAVDDLAHHHRDHAAAVGAMWQKLPQTNPALLIPMDATDGSPKDRLYPVSFRNPFPGFLDLFYRTYNALVAHLAEQPSGTWAEFNQLRNQLIGELYYFGQLLQAHKALALKGESANMATLKLLGHLPDAVRNVLRKIPENFDFLNEMLTGEEVFSNLGRVAPGTSPTRFTSARDDNDAKTMVWGILTDDQDVMHISLRDFRPEVMALFDIEQEPLAQMITQDFLDEFVGGLNTFVCKLNEIAAATVEATASVEEHG